MHMPSTVLPVPSTQKAEVRGYSWWSWRRRGTPNTTPSASQDVPTDIKQSPQIEETIIKENVVIAEAGPSTSPTDVKGTLTLSVVTIVFTI